MGKDSRLLGLTLLRVAIGLGIAWHGAATLFGGAGMGGFAAFVGKLGFPAPELFAWAAKLSEFLGGVCLVLGAFTRPAALAVAFTMAVAAFLGHAGDPVFLIPPATRAKELALLYLAPALALAIAGPGPLALDAFLRRRRGRTAGQE